MSKPLFSVVIPTRNRAQLIQYAVQSVLDQTYGDFEIIVSNNFSDDDTKEVVAGFSDPRVRYFETTELLEIGNSFEFATSHASGEFITYLSDDDACSVVTLELAKNALDRYENSKLVVWNYCDYLLDSINQYGYTAEPNSVWIKSFDGHVAIKNSRRQIKNYFAMRGLSTYPIDDADFKRYPGLLNAAYHRSLFAQLKERGLNFFRPKNDEKGRCAANDVYSLLLALCAVEEYVYVDYPLHLHGAWQNSSTTTINGTRKYYSASKEEMLVPFRCLTHNTFAANALLMAKNDVGADLDFVEIDWMSFFSAVYREILENEKVGVDVDEDRKLFFEALEKQPPEFQERVRASFPSKAQTSKDKILKEAKNILRPIYRRTGLYDAVNKKRKDNSDSSFLVKGSESGFDNILEFARKMDGKWLEEHKRKS